MNVTIAEADGSSSHAYLSVRLGETRRMRPFKVGESFAFAASPDTAKGFAQLDIFEKVGSHVSSDFWQGNDQCERVQKFNIGTLGGQSVSTVLKVQSLECTQMADANAAGVGMAGSTEKRKRAQTRHKVALEAKNYLDLYDVWGVTQGMLHSVLKQRPDDPVAWMISYLADVQRARTTTKAASADVSPSAPPARAGVGAVVPEEQKDSGPLISAAAPSNVGTEAQEHAKVAAEEAEEAQGAERLFASVEEESGDVFAADPCPVVMPDFSRHHSFAAGVLKRDPSIYAALRDRKTCLGVSLAICIKPGMDVPGHPSLPAPGAVAGDEDSYDVFKELFDGIIQLMHPRYSPSLGHPMVDLASQDEVSSLPVDPSGVLALEAKVRASRNLRGLRLPAACGRAERWEVERVLASALLRMEDEDLRGEYFPLPGSSSYIQASLSGLSSCPSPAAVGDVELARHAFVSLTPGTAGSARCWPEARGVFVAGSGQLVAWLNDEDHIRVASLESGPDLAAAFGRVTRCLEHVEEGASDAGYTVACTERLGYITSCPSNLGAGGLRASMVLRLPVLHRHPGFPDICEALGVIASVPEGGQGGIHEIANRDCLGVSEVSLVNQVIQGCARLVLMEQRSQACERPLEESASSLLMAVPAPAPAAVPAVQEKGEASAATVVAVEALQVPPAANAVAEQRSAAVEAALSLFPPPPGEEAVVEEGITAAARAAEVVPAPAPVTSAEEVAVERSVALKEPPPLLPMVLAEEAVAEEGSTAAAKAVEAAPALAPEASVKELAVEGSVALKAAPPLLPTVPAEDAVAEEMVSSPDKMEAAPARAAPWPPRTPDCRSLEAQCLRILEIDQLVEEHDTAVADAVHAREAGAEDNIEKESRAKMLGCAVAQARMELQGIEHNEAEPRSAAVVAAEPAAEAAESAQAVRASREDEGSATTLEVPSSVHVHCKIDNVDYARLTSEQKGVLSCSVAKELAAAAGVGLTTVQDLSGNPGRASLCAGSVIAQAVMLQDAAEALCGGSAAAQLCERIAACASAVPGIEEATIGPITVSVCTTQEVLPKELLPKVGEAPWKEKEWAGDNSGGEYGRGFPRGCCPPEPPDLSAHHCIMAHILKRDKSIYGLLKDRRTRLGVTFAQCIKPGVDGPAEQGQRTAVVGAVAGDEECYSTFREFFDPLVERRHHGHHSATPFSLDNFQHTNLSVDQVSDALVDPTEDKRYAFWIGLQCNRNIGGLRFPPACGFDERCEAERLVVGALLELEGSCFAGEYFPLRGSSTFAPMPSAMSLETEEVLKRQGLLPSRPDSVVQRSAGLARDWPQARGIFLTDNRRLAVCCNMEDHMQFVSLQQGGDMKEAFARLVLALELVEQNLQRVGFAFARNPRLGFVTADPSNLGTALRASVTLRLPLLSAQRNIESRGCLCRRFGLRARDAGEGLQEVVNWERLGVSEVDLMNKVILGCAALVSMEQKLECCEELTLERDVPAVEMVRLQPAAPTFFEEKGEENQPSDYHSRVCCLEARPSRQRAREAFRLRREGTTKVRISILGAKDLRSADFMGKSDPYCVCTVWTVAGKKTSESRTEVKLQTVNPVWEGFNKVVEYQFGDFIEFNVWDKDLGPKKDDFLGKVTITTPEFFPDDFDGDLLLDESQGPTCESVGKHRHMKRRPMLRVKISVERPKPKLPDLPPAAPGLGDTALPGFPEDLCPARMPDLSMHHNLMADVLRRDPSIYDVLRKRCTRLGVTLARCIKAGVDVAGHPLLRTVGLTAGDAECYDVFWELFGSVIDIRHGLKVAGGSPRHARSDLAVDNVVDVPIDLCGKYAISARVRASRCLAGFRFPSACHREERRTIEGILVGALESLDDNETRGNYYPLRGSTSYELQPDGMTEETEEDLRRDGFAFLEPDSAVMLSSGMGRHWPEARGIFVARSRHLVAWVNEEDHLRLISLQNGADLRKAFARLSGAMAGLQGALERQRHAFAYGGERGLGYLSSCPSNLGTGLRASVMLRIPLLTAQRGFPAICKALHLQARSGIVAPGGSSGAAGVWDISNSDCLGRSEADYVNEVILGCAQLVEMEQALERGEELPPM